MRYTRGRWIKTQEELFLKTLTLKQKLGQLMVIGFDGLTVPDNFTQLMKDYQIGGVILFGRNIGTPKEILSLTTYLQKIAKEVGNEQPLLICLDQENGMVRRLGEGTTLFPGSMLVGATNKRENAFEIGYATGKELKALGINWNLAPVLDVNNNPDNPVIGVRSFGESAELVSDFGSEMMKGMQKAGILTTLKHFPGHGDTNVDSHLGLPVISHDMDRLREVELKPFAKAIEEGADTVMSAHVYFPALEKEENRPATLSKNVMTGLLREELNFKGVITTDCLEMQAISNTIGTDKGAIEAFKAGVDLLMISHNYSVQLASLQALEKAVSSEEIPMERLDASVKRIREMKEKYLTWDGVDQLTEENLAKEVGTDEARTLAEDIYKQGVTLVKEKEGLLPLPKEARTLFIFPDNGHTVLVEDKRFTELDAKAIIQEINPHAEVVLINEATTETVLEKVKTVDSVVVGTLNASMTDKQTELVKAIRTIHPDVIGIGLRSPYDLNHYPEVSTYVTTYEYTKPAIQTAVKALYGLTEITGELPVTLN